MLLVLEVNQFVDMFDESIMVYPMKMKEVIPR